MPWDAVALQCPVQPGRPIAVAMIVADERTVPHRPRCSRRSARIISVNRTQMIQFVNRVEGAAMPRTQRGPIDDLIGYTVTDPTPGDPPEQDYYIAYGFTPSGVTTVYTLWGVGLITIGYPNAEQQAWIADP